jgi:arylsulfatase
MTPFRTEMGTSWEGAFRVPALLRWPGKIEPGTVSNDIVSHLDWLPTLLAAAGDSRVKEKLLKGHQAAGKTFRVHLDGSDMMAHLTGKEAKNPREGFLYFDGEGDLLAIRFDNWKLIFMEQRDPDAEPSSSDPCVPLRVPKLFNLRIDPLERADTSSSAYSEWAESKGYMISAAQRLASKFLDTFRDFPPTQRAASFTLEQVMQKMEHSLPAAGG